MKKRLIVLSENIKVSVEKFWFREHRVEEIMKRVFSRKILNSSLIGNLNIFM